MREDPEATTTAWPRPRIEDEKFKLSEVRSTSPSVPRAGLTRAPPPREGGGLPTGKQGKGPRHEPAPQAGVSFGVHFNT